MTYQNTGFENQKSIFSDVQSNPVGANVVTFVNATKNAPVAGGARVRMVSGSVSFVSPFLAGEEGSGTVLHESVKLQWNFRYQNATTLTALRSEMNRVLDKAIAHANLTSGLVPPVSTTFVME